MWPSVRDFKYFGTSCIREQRRPWRVCAYAQARQSLSCLHTQGRDVDIASEQNKFRPEASLCMSAWALIKGIHLAEFLTGSPYIFTLVLKVRFWYTKFMLL